MIILKKIDGVKIPLIILTNNFNILLNKNIRYLCKLEINYIIKENNERKNNIINSYVFIIYLNIKLWNLKYK